MLKCVLFDFDGTIGDTLPLSIEALRDMVRELSGRVPSDGEITATFGLSDDATVEDLLPGRKDEGMELYLKKFAESLDASRLKPFDGITGLIEAVKKSGAECGLVTGRGVQSLDIALEAFGMDGCFETIEAGNPKSADKSVRIRRVLAKYGVSPDDAIYVGDTPGDVKWSRAVPCRIASAAWAQTAEAGPLEEANPGMVFLSVQELIDFIVPQLPPAARSS
ncbi:MAG: HAD family hydrolase [Synergistaceae bacterium]|nr:HAD family hydrolase [Synergistaceae bacterium]